MKVQYCSDLHLEFEWNSMFLEQFPLKPSAEILLLAGDITYMRQDFYKHPFFDYASRNWKLVYLVPGNHEYYCGKDVNSYDFSTPIEVRKNVFIVNNYTLHIEDVQFIFTTLWSLIDKQFSSYIQRNVADFHTIYIDNKKLRAKTFNLLHEQSLEFLKSELQKSKTSKKIVVTHHIPSKECNVAEFVGSKINSAFCVDLSDFIRKSDIDYWIYGHSHRNLPEIVIGNTRLVTNQLGYIGLKENINFMNDKVIEI